MPFISLENLQLTVQGIQMALKDVWSSVKNKVNRSELIQSDYAQYDDSKLDYIKNRTHYDTRRIETVEYSFDGNLNNREVIYDERIPIGFVKLSDDTYPYSIWEGGYVNIVHEGIAQDLEVTHSNITIYTNPNDGEIEYYIIANRFFVNPRDEYVQVSPTVFLPKGMWGLIEMYMDNDPSNLRSYSASITSGPIHKGELKKLDEKYLPSLQSDWNQSDETASDYVQNRTHYIDWEYAQICTDVSINASWAYTGYEIFGLSPMTFKAGEIYEVTFDGVTYRVAAQVGTTEYNEEITYIGDIVLVGAATEDLNTARLPFCFNNVKNWVQSGGNHTVSIFGMMPIYRKLDERFLPDTVAKANDLQAAQNEIDTLQTDVSTLQSEVGTLQTDTATLRTDVDNIPANFKKKFNLTDKVTGYDYIVEVRDGTLVTRRQPVSAYLASEPTTMHYIHGETFDPTGMVIMGMYEDGSESELFLDDCSIITKTMDYSNPQAQIYCPDVEENIIVDTTVCKKLNSISVSYELNKYYVDIGNVSTYNSTINYDVTPNDGESIDYSKVILEATSSNSDVLTAEVVEMNGVPCVTGTVVSPGQATITTKCRSICGVEHGIAYEDQQTFRVADVSSLSTPPVELSLEKNETDGVIVAKVISNINVTPEMYFDDVEQEFGLIYYNTAKLSGKPLTLGTPGRMRVNVKNATTFPSDGDLLMHLNGFSSSSTQNVKYTWRAFIGYINADGILSYAYSDAISTSYNDLANVD